MVDTFGMNWLIDKPYLIFFAMIPLLVIGGLFLEDSTLAINVHDTYFVIANQDITVLFSIIFTGIGLGYWLTRKFKGQLRRWMTLAHILLTFGGILFITIMGALLNTVYNPLKPDDVNETLYVNFVLWLSILGVLFGQILYPINLILALFKK